MPIRFNCSTCRQLLQVDEKTAGEIAKCPSCGSTMEIPEASAIPRVESTDSPDTALSSNPYAPPYATDDVSYGSLPLQHTIIDVGQVYSTAWEIFKPNIGLLIGATLICVVVNAVFSAVTGGIEWQMEHGNGSAILLLAYVLCQSLSVAAQTFLGIGVVTINLNVARNRPAEIGQLFSGGDVFWPVLGAAILLGISVFCGCLLLIVPGVILALGWWSTKYFIIDQHVPIGESFSLAWEYSRGNKGHVFLIVLLNILVCVLGFAACFVGLFVALPFVCLVGAVTYLTMTGQLVYQPRT